VNGETAVSAAPLIALRDVVRVFQRGDVAVTALDGVSLEVAAGEFVAIMGASGSGKSTLMNLIGLLDRPTSGSYRFDGEEVADFDPDRRAVLRREAFGFIFQQYNLLALSDAAENVAMPAVYAGLPHAARLKRAGELLSGLGMGDRLDHRPGQLSGGQQQRVSIARALMNGGAVILADEPTGALDSRSGVEVMRLLRKLNDDGHTVLLITHDRDVARQARRVVEIKDGKIISDAPTDQADQAAPGSPPIRPRRGDSGRGATWRDVAEAAVMAFAALRRNLMRTLLTLLGVIIGVASVVTMLAVGEGARQEVVNRITAMGANLLLVRPGAPNTRPGGGVTATLTIADAEAVAELPGVAAVSPEYAGNNVTLRREGFDTLTQVNAVGVDYPLVRDWATASGVFFGEEEVRSYAPVTVLGVTVVKALFPDGRDPVGEYVMINNILFQVVGVMAPRGAAPNGMDQDDAALVPITTGVSRLFGQRYVKTVTVKATEAAAVGDLETDMRQLLIARHKTEDFQIRNMASLLQTATETQDTLTMLLGSIAAIALLVGGIGVMNIMLVSVTERTREIGVRMAAGARRINIMLQFNSEALAICSLGGLLGVGLGLGAVQVFAWFGRPVMVTPGPILLAFGSAFATGLLFGYLPARKAADLDPVVALAAD
jgi:macrolide transport system ATP-binding/permease protein